MNSRHFVFRYLGVSADQYNRGALLAADCKNVFRVSLTKSVRSLWDNGQEKRCRKPDYEPHLRKMDGDNPAKTVNTRPMFWAFGIWKQRWFPEHRTVPNIIFLSRFPTMVLNFLWLKHEKHFLHSAASNAPRLYWSAKTPRWRKTKWWESIQLENDKFCRNYPSLKSSWFLSEILNENLEMRGVKGNTFFRGERWIKRN